MSNEARQRWTQRDAAAASGTLSLGPLDGPSLARPATDPMHPILFHLGHFTVPTFGVLAAIGVLSALWLSLYTASLAGLHSEALWDAGVFTVLSALILSRLLLVMENLKSFFSYPLLILALPSLTATGVVLTLITTVIYLRIRRLPLLRTLDAWAPCATLAWVFLALGHLAEGSDPGLPATVRWSILSPTGGARLHPVALYAAIAAVLITIVLVVCLRRHPLPGRTAALAFAASGIAQFLITFLRHPSDALDADPRLLTNVLDPIQWVSLAMVFAAAIIYLQTAPLTSRTPEHHAL
jgi:phosphatidylglycerol---prolipoprotein diacylglyceryl transferase